MDIPAKISFDVPMPVPLDDDDDDDDNDELVSLSQLDKDVATTVNQKCLFVHFSDTRRL